MEPEAFAKRPSLTEEQKVAMLGRPRLGETTRIQIRIKESKEFKVSDLGSRALAGAHQKSAAPNKKKVHAEKNGNGIFEVAPERVMRDRPRPRRQHNEAFCLRQE